MFYQPELFVYLMLLPVTFLVILPSMFSVTRAVVGAAIANREQEVEQQISDQEILAEA